jgi:hypothetical protein
MEYEEISLHQFVRGLICDVVGHRWRTVYRGTRVTEVWCPRCGDRQRIRSHVNVVNMSEYSHRVRVR